MGKEACAKKSVQGYGAQERLSDGAEVRFLQGFRKLRYQAMRTSESFRKLLSQTRG